MCFLHMYEFLGGNRDQSVDEDDKEEQLKEKDMK